MPYRLIAGPDFLRMELTGTLTRADLIALMVEVEAIELASERIPDRLVHDMGLVAREIDANDFLELAARRKTRNFTNAFRTALVASTPAGLGMSRMFQILNDHPQIQVEIFETEREATLWLRGEAWV
jgi:hypothetical protein